MTSKFILGTVQMGLQYGINNKSGQPTENESQRILLEAHENGIALLDTAEAYGTAHQVIGRFHSLNPNRQFRVITKFDDAEVDKNISTKIYTNLKVLGVTNLEGLLFHSMSFYRKYRTRLDDLLLLKEKKILNFIGISLYTNEELEQIIDDVNIDLVQLPFNLLDNFTVRGDLLKKAKEKGKTIHTRSAFLQGLFFKGIDDFHPLVRQLKPQLMKINRIAIEENISISELALAYCLNQKDIDNVLIGVDSLSQLRTNIKSLNFQLKPHVVEEINKIITPDLDLLNPTLWKFKLY